MPRLAGTLAGLGCQLAFLGDDPGRLRVLLEIAGQEVAHRRVDDALDLAVAQLRLRLAFELRLGHSEREHGGESLAAVVTRGHQVLVDAFLLAVGVDRARQRGAESGEVRTTLDRADVVHIGVDVFGEFGRILHGHFKFDALVMAGDVDDILVGGLAGAVEVFDERDDTAIVVERLAFAASLVLEDDLHTAIEECQFLQSSKEDVVLKRRGGKYLRIRFEGGLRAAAIAAADAADVGHRHAAFVLLLIDVPQPADLHLAPLRQAVDDGYAHAMQTARRLVGALLELAAELQHGHHALKRGEAQVLVLLNRDATAVVFDRDRTVVIDRYRDIGCVAGHDLVDRVVDDFIDQVVQPTGAGVGDIHAGPLADVLQVAQILELVGAIFGVTLGLLGKLIAAQVGRDGRGRLRWGIRVVGVRIRISRHKVLDSSLLLSTVVF